MTHKTFKAALSPIFSAIHSRRLAIGLAGLLAPGLLMAAPSGGQVVPNGQQTPSATIAQTTTQNGVNTVVNQTASSAIINWQSFDVGINELVQFVQPSSSAVVLNRVVGGSASNILGSIEANGRVFIVNPQGVMFGGGAQVDVGGLVASTLSISDSNFTSGNFIFERSDESCNSHCSVQNKGFITAGTRGQNEDLVGGYVVLASDRLVSNEGQLTAGRLGDVVLASGNKVTLDLNASGLVSFVVNEATVSAYGGVSNIGDIIAQGGMVLMTTHATSELLADAVNNTGRIEARGIEEDGGDIFLVAAGSSTANVSNGGTLDVSGDEGRQGGHIEITADGDVDFYGGTYVAGDSLTVKGREIYIEDSIMQLTGALKATSLHGDIEIVGYGGYGGYGDFSAASYGDYGTGIIAQTMELSATDGRISVYGSNLGYVTGSFTSQSVSEPGFAGISFDSSLLQGRTSHTFTSAGNIDFDNTLISGAPQGDSGFAIGQFSALTAGDFTLGPGSSIFASRISITGTGSTANSNTGSEVKLQGNLYSDGLLSINTTGGVYGGVYDNESGSTSYVSIYAGALSIRASEIGINGFVGVGVLPAGPAPDSLLLQLAALGAPDTLPSSLAPNVSLIATDPTQDGIYIDGLGMSGDHLYVRAPSFQIYQLSFDETLFFNFDSVKPVINTSEDIFVGIFSSQYGNSASSAPRIEDRSTEAQGVTLVFGSSSYAGDIVFPSQADALGANILYLTTGSVTNADTIVNAGRVVDLNAFRGQLSRGEQATNTQVTSQLQNSLPTGGANEAGTPDGDVENKSTKEDEEGELSCS